MQSDQISSNAYDIKGKTEKKKQDEAHEPECRHVCWETKI